MTLERLLKKYDGDLMLKIGSADGNCFFYCGTVRDLLEHIDEYSNDIYEYAEKKLRSEESRCGFYINEFVRKIQNNVHVSNVETNIKELYHIIESKDYAKKKLEYFVPLRNRGVIDYHLTDKAVEPEDCLVIIIRGSECGKFWTTKDVKSRSLDFNLSYYGTVPDDLSDD